MFLEFISYYKINCSVERDNVNEILYFYIACEMDKDIISDSKNS